MLTTNAKQTTGGFVSIGILEYSGSKKSRSALLKYLEEFKICADLKALIYSQIREFSGIILLSLFGNILRACVNLYVVETKRYAKALEYKLSKLQMKELRLIMLDSYM